jgi:hypothetical protein
MNLSPKFGLFLVAASLLAVTGCSNPDCQSLCEDMEEENCAIEDEAGDEIDCGDWCGDFEDAADDTECRQEFDDLVECFDDSDDICDALDDCENEGDDFEDCVVDFCLDNPDDSACTLEF